jgi:hypothetical protein
MTDPADVDCFVAMVAGIIDAQSSNDPGGDRWIRHLDRLIDLSLDDATRRRRRSGAGPGGRDGEAESTNRRRRRSGAGPGGRDGEAESTNERKGR